MPSSCQTFRSWQVEGFAQIMLPMFLLSPGSRNSTAVQAGDLLPITCNALGRHREQQTHLCKVVYDLIACSCRLVQSGMCAGSAPAAISLGTPGLDGQAWRVADPVIVRHLRLIADTFQI